MLIDERVTELTSFLTAEGFAWLAAEINSVIESGIEETERDDALKKLRSDIVVSDSVGQPRPLSRVSERPERKRLIGDDQVAFAVDYFVERIVGIAKSMEQGVLNLEDVVGRNVVIQNVDGQKLDSVSLGRVRAAADQLLDARAQLVSQLLGSGPRP